MDCHRWCHAHPGQAYDTGWLVFSWQNPAEITPVPLKAPPDVHEHPRVAEGETCPTCERRVPRKKKASSPDTKVFSLRIPIDDVDTFKETLDAAAEHAGLTILGHHRFWTIQKALVLLLQAPKAEL